MRLIPTLLMKALAIFALIIAVSASGDDVHSTEEVVPESDGTRMSDVLAHEELQSGFNPMFLQAPPNSNKRILKNIKDLFAYCRAARDKALDMTAEHKGRSRTSAPILRLIIELGKKSKEKNIVWHYMKAFRSVKSAFRIGIGSYFLNIVHNSIRLKKGVVSFESIHEPPTLYDFMGHHSRAGQKAYLYVKLKPKAMGFTMGDPQYFKTLRVHVDDYRKAQQAIKVSGSFKAARKACLTYARESHFARYQAKLNWKRAVREGKAQQKLKAGAMKTITKAKVLLNKPNKGVSGAKATLKKNGAITVKSNNQIVAKAKRLANDWAHKHGRCGSLVEMLDLSPLGSKPKKKAKKRVFKNVKTIQPSKETQAKVARAKKVRAAAREASQKAHFFHGRKESAAKTKKAKTLERKGKVMKADVLRKTLKKERGVKARKRQKLKKEQKSKAAKLKELTKKAAAAKARAAEKKKKHAKKEKDGKARAKAADAAAKQKAAALKAKSCAQRVWNTNTWYANTDCCRGCDGRSPAPGGMKGACTARYKLGWMRSRCQCKATPKGAMSFRTSRYYFGSDCCAGCTAAGSKCAKRHKGLLATSTCTCTMSC